MVMSSLIFKSWRFLCFIKKSETIYNTEVRKITRSKKNEILRLPENGSISINLDKLLTTTTVEFSENYAADEIIFNGGAPNNRDRVIKHIDLIRNLAETNIKAKVITNNNFPTAAGIASSASGFAALTVAATAALGLKLSEKDLSILALPLNPWRLCRVDQRKHR